MDSEVRRAITAIWDPLYESAIASGLQRLGWEIIYRATDSSSLQRFIAACSGNFTVVASSDFRGLEQINKAELIIVNSPSPKAKALSDHELYMLLEGDDVESELTVADIPALAGSALLFAGVAPKVGTTTFAYNAAFELALSGYRTLLIDANLARPAISQRLELFGINRASHSLRDGLDVTEIDSLAALQRVAELSREYQRVVIDIGELRVRETLMKGQRVEDRLVRWALHSSQRLHLALDELTQIPPHLRETLHWIDLLHNSLEITLALHPYRMMSKREEAKAFEDLSRSTSLPQRIYPFERRLEKIGSLALINLSEVAPRSPIRRALLNELGLS